MSNYSEWVVLGSDGGDVTYMHTICNREIDPPYTNKLADDLAMIDAHDCPGRPQVRPVVRCKHGAPVYACRACSIADVMFPVAR